MFSTVLKTNFKILVTFYVVCECFQFGLFRIVVIIYIVKSKQHVQYNTIQYNTIQYNTIQCNIFISVIKPLAVDILESFIWNRYADSESNVARFSSFVCCGAYDKTQREKEDPYSKDIYYFCGICRRQCHYELIQYFENHVTYFVQNRRK